MGEWTIFLGVLVDAHERSGATATGLASIGLLVPYVVVGPLTGALAARYSPQRVRFAGFAVQAAGFGVAALAAAAEAPVPLVVLAAAIGVGAVASLRPTGAALLPTIVRSSRELTVGNLWIGYCEGVGALAGPVLGTGLLLIGGAPAVIAGCAIASLLALAVSVLPRPIAADTGGSAGGPDGTVRRLVQDLRELSERPGALGVLAVAGAQFVVIGALDIIVVVVAEDRLGLGESGPGVLVTLFSLGGAASTVVATRLVTRRRLGPVILLALTTTGLLSLALGGALVLAAAVVLLPLIGMSRGLIDVLADVLLHRSATPDALGSVYSSLELSAGAGLIVGSLSAQILIALSGPRAALLGVGLVLLATAVASRAALNVADDGADVPVVEMSLLRALPVFAPLPRRVLEDVARAAHEVPVEPGAVVIEQGATGDRFYAVSDGSFEVMIDRVTVGSIGRGGSFGEIALLADVPRQATVRASSPGRLLAIERVPFLVAVTGHDSARRAAWNVLREYDREDIVVDDPDGPGGVDPDGDPHG